MRVVDLAPEHESLYFVCLEDWNPDLADVSAVKASWYARMKDRGLRVKVALDDDGRVGGMIQYLPIELGPAVGHNLELVLCIWVHGHARGRGRMQGRGMGSALLEAAEADARGRGVAGLAAWGLLLPFWMKASWFRKHGYRKADRDGISLLMWKPFAPDACAPRWMPRTGMLPLLEPGRVVVTVCRNGWCPAQNLTAARACRAAASLRDERLVVHELDVADKASMLAWGRADALFVDHDVVWSGPPPSEARLRRRMARKLRRLPRRTE